MSDPLIKPYNPLARFLPPNTPPNVRPPEKAAAPTETSAPTPATAPASQGKAPSASPSVANPPSAEKTREAAQSGSVDSETAAHLTPAVNGFWEQAETGMEAIQQENAYHLEGPHGEVSQALESSISDVQGLVDAHRDGTSGHTLSESDLQDAGAWSATRSSRPAAVSG